MFFLRQSTAVDVAIGPFLDETDGVTPMTGLTISQADVRLKKNNGAWAQVTDATGATHEEAGWYEKELDATDTATVGQLLISIQEATALPVWHEFQVVEEAVYDALYAASAVGPLLATSTGSGLTSLATAAALATVDGIVDDILLDTAEIGTAGAGLTNINLPDQTMAITGNITGNLSGSVGSVATGGITAASIANGAIDALTFAADTGLGPVRTNTAAAGAAGTITLDASAPTTADLYNGHLIYLVGGTGVGQARFISDYSTGRVASVSENWITTPDNTSVFVILPSNASGTAAVVDAVLDDQIGDGTITLREAVRVILAAVAGELSGAGTTTVTIRNLADSADVVVATVDADGNRSALTVTP